MKLNSNQYSIWLCTLSELMLIQIQGSAEDGGDISAVIAGVFVAVFVVFIALIVVFIVFKRYIILLNGLLYV